MQRKVFLIQNYYKDMIGIAPTGSGKSVAFLVPMITYLNKLPSLDDQTC
jgi:ATP-dependent RNA helicase DDX23/PRP28